MTLELLLSQGPHRSQPLQLYKPKQLKVNSSSTQAESAFACTARGIAIAMENNRTINDLPLGLIHEILLRLPLKSLSPARRVCRMWLYVISNPNFAESHFELAALPTRGCLFIQGSNTLSFDLDALFHDGYDAVNLSLPCENPSTVHVLESCRGFILLDEYPHLVIWNPLTDARKQISCSHVVSDADQRLRLVGNGRLCGFGYDPSQDDYLVVLAWSDNNKEDHFDYFSVRNSSWNNFGVALPSPILARVWRCGLFLKGAFHWLASPSRHNEPILVFDLMERSFSEIPLPQPLVGQGPGRLLELGGCLAMCLWSNDEFTFMIWVMKEYKVQSSWTSYAISDSDFWPIALSSDGNIVGIHGGGGGDDDDDDDTGGFYKYSVSGEQLEHANYQQLQNSKYAMYTKSLLSLPNES